RKVIRKRMKSLTRQVGPDDLGAIVGTSGTVRALARMEAMANGGAYPEHQHGMLLTRDGVDQLAATLSAATQAERSDIPGMDARRVRTLPSGAVLVQEVLEAFDKPLLVTSNRSLRDGLIVDWILNNKPELTLSRQLADPRSRSVRATMERYGADIDHADSVANTAQALFDATGPVHRLRIDDRRLLTFAAHLHDVGHHIAGRGHDKRGAYLIRHTHMPGFTAPEVSVLERLVRYHSNKRPKSRHGRYAALGKADRKRVRILSSLLCLADAFDRGHHQNLIEIDIQLHKRKLTIRATPHQSPDLERWATDRRKRRVEDALDIEVDIVFSGPHGGAVGSSIGDAVTSHEEQA
ncbi:MAG: exopolyphosphatase/guanosine-5'-triphosphate,3'-diphosphate pyrophosphatase, partial [Myxococcota bacterium]